MDLRQLNALVAVADEGSFSAAAEALHTVQSNVSTHVAHLERELGVTLYDRGAARLTEEGRAVVDRARRVSAELDALVADVASLRADVVGSVRVGMIGTTARWLVPRLLELVGERHPQVSLVVLDATSTSLAPQVVAGALDFAVVNLPLADADLTEDVLFYEDLVLMVPSDHALARRTSVTLADLDGLELLLPPKGTSFRREIDAGIGPAGVTLRPKMELDGVRLIASLAIEGHAAAIVPASAVTRRVRGSFAMLPVDDLHQRCVGVVQRRRGMPTRAARTVIDTIREITASSGDQGSIHPVRHEAV